MRARSVTTLELVWGLRQELLENEGVKVGEKSLDCVENITRLKIRVHRVKKRSRLIAVGEARPREREDGHVEQAH